jgi:signal transduction histidine kinase
MNREKSSINKIKIEQVFLNLFVNAADAMPDGGDLTLVKKNAILDEQFKRPFKVLPGKYMKVSVSDTGHGILGFPCEWWKNRFRKPCPKGSGQF